MSFQITEQIGFDEQILSEDYDEYEWEDGDDELAEKLESVRSHAIGLLQDRSRPIAERIAVYLNYCCQMQKELFETVPKEEEPEKSACMRHFYSGCPNTRSLNPSVMHGLGWKKS